MNMEEQHGQIHIIYKIKECTNQGRAVKAPPYSTKSI